MPSDNPYVYQCPIFGDYHDPLAVRRGLFLRDALPLIDEQKSENVTVTMQAHEKLLPIIREVFRLPPIDRVTGAGVADEQALQVLEKFIGWLEGKV